MSLSLVVGTFGRLAPRALPASSIPWPLLGAHRWPFYARELTATESRNSQLKHLGLACIRSYGLDGVQDNITFADLLINLRNLMRLVQQVTALIAQTLALAFRLASRSVREAVQPCYSPRYRALLASFSTPLPSRISPRPADHA